MLLAFPYYNGIFCAIPTNPSTFTQQPASRKVTFEGTGMICTGCEHHIEGDLNATPGVFSSDVDCDRCI